MEREVTTVPTGYMRDALERLVPESLVPPIDKLRSQLCVDTVRQARDLQQRMKAFKAVVYGDVHALLKLAAEQYDVQWGGKQGNVTVVSYDGCLKIQVAIQKTMAFGEQIHVAKQLIDECLEEWTADSRDEIRTLIQDAFRVDASGELSTTRILSLRRLEITDPRWVKAMQAIADSLTVCGSKAYLRIYERPNSKAEWQAISLDMACL